MTTVKQILEIGKEAEKLVNGPKEDWYKFVNNNHETIEEANKKFFDYVNSEFKEQPDFFLAHYDDDDAWRRDKLNSLTFEEFCEFEHPNIMSDYSYSVFDGYKCLGAIEFGTDYVLYEKVK